MRNFLLLTVLAVAVSFGFSHLSYSACGGASPNFFCNDSPPNPDLTGIQQAGNINNLTVNVLPGASIDVTSNSDDCIITGNGEDNIDVDGGDLKCDGGSGGNNGIVAEGGTDTINVTDSTIDARDALSGGPDSDTFNVERSTLIARDDCIDGDPGDDIVNFTDVICIRGAEGMELSSGNDKVNLLRSQIICREEGTCQEAIEASNDDDEITIVESILRNRQDDILDLGSGNDILRFGTGSDVEGSTDCSSGFDTIVFFMDVPEDDVDFLSSQIASLDPAADSITINGLTYEWRRCELLVADLNGVKIISPVPTLSEWGLISMAALLGIVGFMVIRRRQATA